MAYNKNLYTSSTSALDAGIVYDQTETKMQSEVNAALKSSISSEATTRGNADTALQNTLNQLETAVGNLEVVVVSLTSPITFGSWYSNSNIEDDMVVLQSTLGTPSAQTADWTVTTDTGQFKIEGQSGTAATTLTLYFMKSR